MAEKKSEEKVEREYVIPLRDKCRPAPRYRKTSKAVKTVKEFLARHMRVPDRDLNKIKLNKYVNEFLWARGIRSPPHKIKVKVVRDGENILVDLVEMPKKLGFKRAREERKEKAASEIGKKKKAEIDAAKKAEEETEKAETKEEEEKKAAVVESGAEIEKSAAKKAKHSTELHAKEPKRQKRVALKK